MLILRAFAHAGRNLIRSGCEGTLTLRSRQTGLIQTSTRSLKMIAARLAANDNEQTANEAAPLDSARQKEQEE
jgi:hypothetical protein